ncbi:MAG: PHP domain-containing protein [Caldilineaceae bacterium]|nr:PHP domain-containing protein [Caldilineaceae bacterium]
MTYPVYPIDLQCHSTFSDGTETPTELVTHAARLGIGVLAITDHDSVLGVAEALDAGAQHGVHVIPAIEFSTTSDRARDFLDINILGYGLRHEDDALLDTLTTVIEARVEQKIRQIEKLQGYGVHVPVDEVLALADGVPGRPHIAQVALKHNPSRFSSLSDVFAQFLAADAPNSVYVTRSFSLTVEAAIELTHAAGGVAVLAHPGIYHRVRDIDAAIHRMIDAGLDGIEIHYPYAKETRRSLPGASPAQLTTHFAEIARRHNLLVTGGSDYHGERKTIHLGEAGLTLAQWQRLQERAGWA